MHQLHNTAVDGEQDDLEMGIALPNNTIKKERLERVTCPITLEIYNEPIKLLPVSPLIQNGQPQYVTAQLATIERLAYEQLCSLELNQRCCPLTKQTFAGGMIDWEMKRLVEAYLKDYPLDITLQHAGYPPQEPRRIQSAEQPETNDIIVTTQAAARTITQSANRTGAAYVEKYYMQVCNTYTQFGCFSYEFSFKCLQVTSVAVVTSAACLFSLSLGILFATSPGILIPLLNAELGAAILKYELNQNTAHKLSFSGMSVMAFTEILLAIAYYFRSSEVERVADKLSEFKKNHPFLLLLCADLALTAPTVLLAYGYLLAGNPDYNVISLPKLLSASTLGAGTMCASIGFLRDQIRRCANACDNVRHSDEIGNTPLLAV